MRLKSNARWMDLPGVECAYQSIGAPSAVDALLNVAHDHRMVGRYTATPGVLPTWGAATGWTFNGSTQYLTTDITPAISWSALVQFTGITNYASNPSLFGISDGAAGGLFSIRVGNAFGPGVRYQNPGVLQINWGAALTSGNLALAGQTAYKNGVAESGTIPGVTAIANQILIGAARGPLQYMAGKIQAVAIASRTLSPAEVWLASRQMAYCEQNDAWNAWARRRMYFYAPSAAAGRVGIYGARGAVALPGGVRIGTVNDA